MMSWSFYTIYSRSQPHDTLCTIAIVYSTITHMQILTLSSSYGESTLVTGFWSKHPNSPGPKPIHSYNGYSYAVRVLTIYYV